jgi:hypothetical protein
MELPVIDLEIDAVYDLRRAEGLLDVLERNRRHRLLRTLSS